MRHEMICKTPVGFAFPPGSTTEAVFAQALPTTAPAYRRNGWTFAVGRLTPGATVEGATNALGSISKQLEVEFPQSNEASTYFAVPLRDAFVGNTRTALLLLLGAVALVLLIACTNVSNLILARALARRREMAVRLVVVVLLFDVGLTIVFPLERTQTTFFIRTAGDPDASSAAVQRAMKDIEPQTVFLQTRTLAAATTILAAAAMLACYVPAKRAAAVDPARTLVEQ